MKFEHRHKYLVLILGVVCCLLLFELISDALGRERQFQEFRDVLQITDTKGNVDFHLLDSIYGGFFFSDGASLYELVFTDREDKPSELFYEWSDMPISGNLGEYLHSVSMLEGNSWLSSSVGKWKYVDMRADKSSGNWTTKFCVCIWDGNKTHLYYRY